MTKNLVLYWITDTLATVTDVIFSMAIALIALQYGRNAWGSGLILFTASIPYLIFGLIGGVAADRLDKRRLMVVCDLTRAMLIGILPVAAATHHLSVALIVTVGLLATTVRAFYFPARKGLTPDLVSDGTALGKFNLYLNASASFSSVLAPSLGSIVVIWTHQVANVFYLPMGTLLISALCVYLLRLPTTSTNPTTSLFADLASGLKHVFASRSPIPYLLAAFALQLVVGSGMVKLTLPTMLGAMHLPRNVSFGFMLSIIALAETVMSFLWPRWAPSRSPSWIFGGYLVRALCHGLFVWAMNIGGIIPVLFAALLFGVTFPMSGPTLTTTLQLYTPRPLMAKVMAIRSTIGNLSDAGSYLFIGGLLQAMPIPRVFWTGAVIGAASAIIFFTFWSRHPATLIAKGGRAL